MGYHSEYYLTYTTDDARIDKADGLPALQFPQAPVPQMDVYTALHILGEINQAIQIQRQEDTKTWLDQGIRAGVFAEWQAVIDRKRTQLLAAGFRTRLSVRTRYYVPDGGGHGWKYAGQ